MSMTLRRARQVIKQRNVTAQRILKVLESGPIDDPSLFDLLRKRGWKEGQGLLHEMIVALTVTGKVRTNKRVHRLATDDEPMPQRPVKAKLADVWPEPVDDGHENLKKLLACTETETTTTPEPEQPKENDMDLSTLTPDQMLAMAAQMQKMAEAKKRELDPELLRQLLEAGQSVLDASDLMVEATDRFRRAMDAVREARGLPTTKKV